MTEPVGNAVQFLPTVRMMGTANSTTVGNGSVAFPSEPVKGMPLRGGYILPLVQNPGTALVHRLTVAMPHMHFFVAVLGYVAAHLPVPVSFLDILLKVVDGYLRVLLYPSISGK